MSCLLMKRGLEKRMIFRKAILADKEEVDSYMKLYGESSCQHSFLTIYCMYEKYGDEICIEDEFLFVQRKHIGGDKFQCFLAPMGQGDLKQAYQKIIDQAHSKHKKVSFMTLTEKHKKFVEENFPGKFAIYERKDYAEYLYRTYKLAHFSGKKLKDKRREVKVFLKEYEGRISVNEITRDDISSIWKFEQYWMDNCAEAHDKYALERESRMIYSQLNQFEELGLLGIVVRIEGRVCGFRYGIPLNEHCIDAIVEKGDRSIPHIYQYLKNEAAKQCEEHYEWMNFEEDVGDYGLRKSKLSYDPDLILRKYYLEEL